MRFILLLTFILTFGISYGQTVNFPKWFIDTFKAKGLDKKYDLNPFLKPAYLRADFNGDGSQDIAASVIEKTTKKKGIMLIHAKIADYFIFGAGTNFGNGSDDFNWADKWQVYNGKIVAETQFDKTSGDIIGSKKIKLSRPGILIAKFENGALFAGAVIYWTGKKYIWIHQGE